MSQELTKYIRWLASSGDPSGTTGEGKQRLDRAWSELRTMLRAEIQRRGLWGAPPSYLGVDGWISWAERGERPARPGPGGRSDALEELMPACFDFAVRRRLQSLMAHARLGEAIEGFVVLNVRHFVTDRQRANDQIGHWVFSILRQAIAAAVEEGWLVAEKADEPLRNQSRLTLSGDVAERSSAERELTEAVTRWADDLPLGSYQVQGKRRTEILAKLRQNIWSLRDIGLKSFRLGQVADPLKREVRRLWSAVGVNPVEFAVERRGDDRTLLPISPADASPEEWEILEKLADCVEQHIQSLATTRGTKNYLSRLWHYAVDHASGMGFQDGIDLPSMRKLSGELGIPRERLPALLETIRELAGRCRATISGEGRG